MTKKITVTLIDDSAVVRKVLQEVLIQDPDIEVISTASDPLFALKHMDKQWPDVIVTDIEMPRMDGITFLKKIMIERPTPVVVCSTLTQKGAETSIQALNAGAISIVTKPKIGLKDFLHNASSNLIREVKAAARSNIKNIRIHARATVPKKISIDEFMPQTPLKAMTKTTEQIIAIGTSTGGTQALEAVLSDLPKTSLGIVVVQHMPEKFTESFARRLNSICHINVKEAANNDRVLAGTALIAPGGKHLTVKRSGAQYYVEVKDGPLVNRHKPSVDVLFRSVAAIAGKNALGVIMTGMGNDGAKGLKEIQDAGGSTVAQDEKSCVVFGMPKEAITLGAADKVVSLSDIPREMRAFAKR